MDFVVNAMFRYRPDRYVVAAVEQFSAEAIQSWSAEFQNGSDRLALQFTATFAAVFRGHSSKFCSGIGEIIADLAMKGQTTEDVLLLRTNRFLSD
jgi:glycine/D-amino acid oxidase-like deaminating enzyme